MVSYAPVARKKSTHNTSTTLASDADVIRVRRIHRRDLNRAWEFLKRVFRAVNRETVEYQRPRTKTRFLEIYEEEGIEQLMFEIKESDATVIVGYAECAYEVLGSDNWINERYFENRNMRPLFVEEIAIHPDYQGRGIGGFVIEQLEHLARVHGCTHLVLEVAENNGHALKFYLTRSFFRLDAAIFLAKKIVNEPDLLPPRMLKTRPPDTSTEPDASTRLSAAPPTPELPPAKADKPPIKLARALTSEPTPPPRREGSPATDEPASRAGNTQKGRKRSASRRRTKTDTAK